MTALELANYIVNRAIEAGLPVSNLKLQKMLYFVNLLHIRRYKQFLIRDIDDNPFEAWQFGPVIAKVYDEFSIYGGLPIHLRQEEPSSIGAGEAREILNSNIYKLLQVEPWTLVDWSHIKNGAWDKTYIDGYGNHRVISNELIIQDAGI